MKKSSISLFLGLFALMILPLSARDTPRGFEPLAKINEEQAKAVASKRLVVLMVKGANDSCPHCVSATNNGLKAIGSGVTKLFARAEGIAQTDMTGFPEAVSQRLQRGFTTGAAVTFVVFNPEMTEIIVEAGRSELQSDRQSIAAFKTAVQDAKKALR